MVFSTYKAEQHRTIKEIFLEMFRTFLRLLLCERWYFGLTDSNRYTHTNTQLNTEYYYYFLNLTLTALGKFMVLVQAYRGKKFHIPSKRKNKNKANQNPFVLVVPNPIFRITEFKSMSPALCLFLFFLS